ncbi:MAG: cache domain-containing protein [Marinobacterium sp.]|nr:cache domain-containing protein [Marinobacterium sp.]
MDTTFRKDRFSAHYMKIMSLTFIVLIAMSGMLLHVQSQQALDAEKDRIKDEFENWSVTLDSLVVSVGEHINILQSQAESWLNEPVYDNSLAFKMISPVGNGYNLDHIALPYTIKDVGNLSGVGDLYRLSSDVRTEIEMALSLNSIFKASHENIPNLAWVYYTSKNRFINIYPWVDSSKFSYLDELHTHEFFQWGLPDKNPDRRAFWTPVYVDEAGKGLMVTAAQPVYRKNEFLGTVAIDITLGRLTELVKNFEPGSGEMMIVNQQNQIVAHPVLTDHANDGRTLSLDSVLPEALKNLADEILIRPAMERSFINGYEVIWHDMQSAPWKIIFIYDKGYFYGFGWSRLNMDILLLIVSLAAMLYVSSKMTFREFINPAEKLVNHIATESQKVQVEKDITVPEPWRPWFKKISRIFSENQSMVEEIRRTNEDLLEKNKALERYMPKTIVLISLQPCCGASTLGHFICRGFSGGVAECKSTAYVEYPEMSGVLSTFSSTPSVTSDGLYHHPAGYDVWSQFDTGDMPAETRATMLINSLLENYGNIVININIQACSESDLAVLLRYAKIVVVLVPQQEQAWNQYSLIYQRVADKVRQDKTPIYSLYNCLGQECPERAADFVIPVVERNISIPLGNYEIADKAESIVKELINRVERTHQVAIFIPTTINVDTVVDTSAYVEKTMALLGEKFGGATCSQANGVWNSSKGELVNEVVNVVVSYTTEDALSQYINDIIEFVREVKTELSQDAMALEVNKKLILI